MRKRHSLLPAFLLAALLPLPAVAQDEAFPAATAVEVPEEMREMMRAWILSEPEIIEQAIGILNVQREAEAAEEQRLFVERNIDALLADDLPFYGSAAEDAVEIVKFSDYRCTFCMQAHGILSGVLEERPNVRVILHEIPVLGEDSLAAANLALSVLERDGREAWAELHHLFLGAEQPVNRAILDDLAQARGYDIEELVTFGPSTGVMQIMDRSRALAEGMGVNGTPTFVINGQVYFGVQDRETLLSLIDAAASGTTGVSE